MPRFVLTVLLLLCLEAFAQSQPANMRQPRRYFYPQIGQPGVKKLDRAENDLYNTYTSWAELAEKSRSRETPISLTLQIDSMGQQPDWVRLRQVKHVRQLQLRLGTRLTQPLADSLSGALAYWSELDEIQLSSSLAVRPVGQPSAQLLNGKAGAQLKSVRRLQVSSSGDQLPGYIQLFSQCPSLYSLTINDYNYTGKSSVTLLPVDIGQMKQLRELHLNGPTTAANLDQILSKLPDLAVLQLNYSGDGDGLMNALQQVPKLQKLQLILSQNETKLTQLRLGHLTQLDTLYLQLARNSTVSIDSVLVGVKSLKVADIFYSASSSLAWMASNLDLRRVQLIGCRIKPPGPSLSKLTRLEAIHLSATDSLSQFPEQFITLPNLRTLTIETSLITAIPPSIGNMTSLTALSFTRSKLRNVPAEIGRLTALKTLNLGYNQLESVPATLVRLENLTDLILAGNQLTSLPTGLGRLRHLRLLALSGNKLTLLPEDLGQCRELTGLMADSNPIAQLPESIGNIDSLRTLSLRQSRLSALPSSIGKLKQLRGLTVTGGHMAALPESLGNCQQLTSLEISDSTLSTLPASINRLSKLEVLRLDLPQLQVIPPGLTSLTGLKMLHLAMPQLLALPDDLDNLVNLNMLTVVSSKLMGLPNTIGKLAKLSQLTIDGKVEPITNKPLGMLDQLPDSIARCQQLTGLTVLNQRAFDGADAIRKTARVPSLQILRLDRCGIDRLTDIDWKTVQVTMLSLQQNSLRDVPESMLEAPNLQQVNLSYNYPLPRALNQNFWAKEMLKTAFIEARLATGQLPTDKPDAGIMQAYANAAMRQVQQRNWGEVFANLEKAILVAPDTLKALPLAQRADLYLFRKEYALAVADFEQAIAAAPRLSKRLVGTTMTSPMGRAYMVPQWWGRLGTARSALGQYDKALSDLNKALDLLPQGESSPIRATFYIEQGKVNANQNKPAEARTSLVRANEVYAALPYAGPGERLTEVELAILTNQPDKATVALSQFRKQYADSGLLKMGGVSTGGGYNTLCEYLATCTAILTSAQTPDQALTSLTTYLKTKPDRIYNWSFELFETMLPRIGLPADKATALGTLTKLTKEQAVKVE